MQTDSAKIKINLGKALADPQGVAIELGCGSQSRKGTRITIDKVDLDDVDIVADIENGLPFLPDASVDEIHCRSVLEHIENFEHVLREMLRILKDHGKVFLFVPHFSNPYYYSDFTHKRFFGLYSFYYFVKPARQMKRKVPVFYTDLRIDILLLKLQFKTPFLLTRYLYKGLGLLINSCRYLQEFYEWHLCYLLPCNGIEVIFQKEQS